jgi:enoyl-CoA hydratase/carnithine racemase
MQASRFETLSAETTNRVAVVTMKRPEFRNAPHRKVNVEIETEFRELLSDDSARIAALNGADPDLCSSEHGTQMLIGPLLDRGQARFGEVFIELGPALDVPGRTILPCCVGPGSANTLPLTGEVIDSGLAVPRGLVGDHRETVVSFLDWCSPRFKGR